MFIRPLFAEIWLIEAAGSKPPTTNSTAYFFIPVRRSLLNWNSNNERQMLSHNYSFVRPSIPLSTGDSSDFQQLPASVAGSSCHHPMFTTTTLMLPLLAIAIVHRTDHDVRPHIITNTTPFPRTLFERVPTFNTSLITDTQIS
jgi:hypothetical protein